MTKVPEATVAVLRTMALNAIRAALALLELAGRSPRSHTCTCGLLSAPYSLEATSGVRPAAPEAQRRAEGRS